MSTKNLEKELLELKKKAVEFKHKQHEVYQKEYGARIMLIEGIIKTAGDCSHPETTEFNWEWDNGFGKQKSMVGAHCTICDKENRWPDSSKLWWERE